MMISIIPSSSSDIQFRRLGQLHFLPVVSKDYIKRYGLPTRDNLEQHLFVQSHYYLAKTGLWDGWQQAVARGRTVHHCDNSLAYGMMVKAGLGNRDARQLRADRTKVGAFGDRPEDFRSPFISLH